MRDTVALDMHPAHGGGVEQHVDQVVVQQVHLVDIEDAAVRARQQARREGMFAVSQHLLQIDGADDAVLGRSDGQLHQAGSGVDGGQHLGEATHRGRFRGALLAADQYAADVGTHRAQDERQPQLVLAHQRAERIGHYCCPAPRPGLIIGTCGMPSSRNSSPSRTNPWRAYISSR